MERPTNRLSIFGRVGDCIQVYLMSEGRAADCDIDQQLVYSDDVNLLWDNTDAIKKKQREN
jgi:hypothetical protein